MEMRGFYFNQDDCIGCRTCQIACKDKNDLPPDILLRRVRTYESGTFEAPGLYHYSGSCNNCADAPCIKACPTCAMHRSDLGTVAHDERKCIRCGTCVRICPYDAPQLVTVDGPLRKCDSCEELLRDGKNPVCVDACPMRALEFGLLSELRMLHEGEALTDSLPCLPDSDTKPSVLIHPRPCALDSSFIEQHV